MAVNADGNSSRKISGFPSFKMLAIGAAVPSVVLASGLLLLGHFALGFAVCGGFAVSLAMTGGLYAFVVMTGKIILGDKTSSPSDSRLQMPVYAIFAIGKFFVLAAFVYLLLGVLKMNIVGFVAGFLVAQLAISIVCIQKMLISQNISR